MDISDLTPTELRKLAARKEAASLINSHIKEDAVVVDQVFPAKGNNDPQAWEKDVEVDGHIYRIDMRRFKSRDFNKAVLAAQNESGTMQAEKQLELMDYAFAPNEDEISQVVENEMGYVDFERYYEICAEIFGKLDLKN